MPGLCAVGLVRGFLLPGFLLGRLLLPELRGQAPADPAASFDRAIGAAEGALQKGDFAAAERHYREALFAGWMLRATLERLEGRGPEAREALRNASLLKIEGREAATHLAEAKRLSASSSSEPAAPNPEPVALEPNEEAAASGLPASRRQELSRKTTAGLTRAYMNLGVMQVRSQRFLEAAELFEKAAALDPDFPDLQRSLGIAYFDARQFDKAAGPLSRALAARPDDASLKRMLGMAWLNAEAYEKAAQVLGADPELTSDPSLQLAYGLALARSDRAAEAERVFSLLLTRHGDTAELNVLLGKAHAQMGDFDSAVASLQRALGQKADVAEANATLGVIYLKQGRLAEAEEALRAELRGHPADVQSQQNLAATLEMLQRPEEAIPLLRSVLKAKPDFADARYLLGKILLAQGAAPEAVEQLEAAARVAPGDANIHYQLARAYQAQGRTELAEQELQVFRQLKDKRRDDAR